MESQQAGPDPPLARPGHFSSLAMDLSAHRVTCEGRKLHLSPTEFRLLRALMERPTHVFSRETLLIRLWGRDLDLEIRTGLSEGAGASLAGIGPHCRSRLATPRAAL